MFTELKRLVYLSTSKHTGRGGASGRSVWEGLLNESVTPAQS